MKQFTIRLYDAFSSGGGGKKGGGERGYSQME